MNEPEWYNEWRHAAVHELQSKNKALAAEFKTGDWPRYDYDIDTGTLVFSDASGPKVRASIQVVGTTSLVAGDWLWAWANSHWPDASIQSALIAKQFGEEHGICELTHRQIADRDDLNGLGWALTSVVAKVAGCVGAYRPPRDEGGGLYLVYTQIGWIT
jgi:hypothetical protein